MAERGGMFDPCGGGRQRVRGEAQRGDAVVAVARGRGLWTIFLSWTCPNLAHFYAEQMTGRNYL